MPASLAKVDGLQEIYKTEGLNLVKRRALIIGISGQDGAYLAGFLLDKSYMVYGSTRDLNMQVFSNLAKLDILDKVNLVQIAPEDEKDVLSGIARCEPDEIYFLSGQSSVGYSFEQPVLTFSSIALATMHVLNSIKELNRPIRLFNASSGDCYGETATPATELTVFSPRSPYAVAKAASHMAVANYRTSFNLYCCSGILFPHESPLRSSRFVTQKIVSAAFAISKGSKDKLRLGNLSISRDWGYAGDYVSAMWAMLQQTKAEDFIISTGICHSLAEFLEIVFRHVDLDWKEHVLSDPQFIRSTDIQKCLGSPMKAKEKLGWKATTSLESIVKKMFEAIE